MSYRGRLFFEKMPAWVIGFCLLGLFYWPLRGLFMPADPLGPTFMLGTNGVYFAVAMLVAAGVACLATPMSRMSGTMFAFLLGVAGPVFNSGKFYDLIADPSGKDTQSLFLQMLGEVILLGAVAAAGMVLIGFIRKIIAKCCSSFAWSPLAKHLPASQIKVIEPFEGENKSIASFINTNRETLVAILRYKDPDNISLELPGQKAPSKAAQMQQIAGFIATVAAVGVIIASIMMQSSDRGQVIFGLAAGFGIAGYVGSMFFPNKHLHLAWTGAILGAVMIYAVGFFTQADKPIGQVWHQFQALPIDWLTAGGAGALLGSWIYERSLDATVVDALEHAHQQQAEV